MEMIGKSPIWDELVHKQRNSCFKTTSKQPHNISMIDLWKDGDLIYEIIDLLLDCNIWFLDGNDTPVW